MTTKTLLNAPHYSQWIGQLAQLGTAPAVTFVATLRLAVVTATLLATFAWQHYADSHVAVLELTLIVTAVLAMSGLTLAIPALKQQKTSVVREILFDLAWISLLLWYAGRAENPFIYYLIVVVAIASLLLSFRTAAIVTGLSICVYTGLLFVDVQAHINHLSSGYRLHLIGMWINFILSASIVFLCVSVLMAALRLQHKHMLSVSEQRLKSEQLIGLATVSASAVHNLATPLTTLRLLVDEFAYDHQTDNQLQQDVSVMRQQIGRCEETINTLSALAQNSDTFVSMPARALLESVEDHYAIQAFENKPDFELKIDNSLAVRCTDLLKFALLNLINNAIESTLDRAKVAVYCEDNTLLIDIINSVSPEDSGAAERWGKPTDSNKKEGLGIGSFLANSTIEQQSGRVRILEHSDASATILTIRVMLPLVNSAGET